MCPVHRLARARLIPELWSAHNFWSVRLMALGAAFLVVWPEIPAAVRAELPYSNQVGAIVLVAALFARVLKQRARNDD